MINDWESIIAITTKEQKRSKFKNDYVKKGKERKYNKSTMHTKWKII